MLLKVEHVTMSFAGITALKDVSFEVSHGEVFAIIGPNGAGKTTLFNCLSRFYTPSEGNITFNKIDLLRYRPNQIAGIGVTRSFQNLELFPTLTVEENLLIGLHHSIGVHTLTQAFQLKAARQAERQAREQAYDVMERLGICRYAKHDAGTLPYGIRKLTDIGRALISRPKLLLLDEPAAGMNEVETEQLGVWISELPKKYGITVMMVEHDMPLVMGISDHIAVLNFGELITVGTPNEVCSNPEVITAYLGEKR